MPCRNPRRIYIHLAFTYILRWSLKRSVKWTWTGSAFSTNESAWSVMVVGSQSRVWSGPYEGTFHYGWIMLWLTITKCLVLVIRFQSEWDPITHQVVDNSRKYTSFSFQWRCCWLGFKRLCAKIARIPTPRVQIHKIKSMEYWNTTSKQ
jgi:hypothetical protein